MYFAESLMRRCIAVRSITRWPRAALEILPTCSMPSCSSQCFSAASCHGRLAERTDFPTRSIEVMDGSKRSRHSNAFFTGFGRFRKVVLFDTLVAQLTEPELESVLAHEIGHYKKRHVMKLLSVSIAGVFVAFAAIAWLARQQWFYHAFGFQYQAGFAVPNVAPAILLFGLLAGTVSFWLSPLIHIWSRRF